MTPGVPMRQALMASLALVVLAAAPAAAFQIKSATANPDGTPNLTPSGHLTEAPPPAPSGASGRSLHFGNTTMTFGSTAGSDSYDMSPALRERLMLGPYAPPGDTHR